MNAEHKKLVVCLGASIVRGQFSANFVDMLKTRLSDFQFVNAGVNGDLAYNVLRRLDAVLAQQPRQVEVGAERAGGVRVFQQFEISGESVELREMAALADQQVARAIIQPRELVHDVADISVAASDRLHLPP